MKSVVRGGAVGAMIVTGRATSLVEGAAVLGGSNPNAGKQERGAGQGAETEMSHCGEFYHATERRP